ncbi:hypothetical protein CKO25_03470 [Thiocapsa imhoffii]|uniref:Uncharacterized protein n=1 Tax=Thiocapsa imhoffii TaxID=382777 RepID=A0A9X0WFV8_9GAMM|nr:hemin uptake protein HemP [Thiocapsa imhoffii]MBK1643735.1 hypothetical protein [Thiocapsa imhoffii]
MRAIERRQRHPRPAQPTRLIPTDPASAVAASSLVQHAVYSAELFDPGGELPILHRGRLYRLRLGPEGELELVGPAAMATGQRHLVSNRGRRSD